MNWTRISAAGLPLILTVPFTGASLGPPEQPTVAMAAIRKISARALPATARINSSFFSMQEKLAHPSAPARLQDAEGLELLKTASFGRENFATRTSAHGLQGRECHIRGEE